MTARPLVSVVVLNHNGLRYLDDCLASLETQTYHPLEIILVDNGSRDDSVSVVRRRHPDVRLLCLPENVGFAAGNNRGFQLAEGAYLAILNNDAKAAPDWVEKLVEAAERNPDYGMFGCRILLCEFPDRIDKAGHLMYWDGQNKGRGSGEPDGHQFSEPTEIFFPDGCAALYRRSLLEDIGGFDEVFFAYGDDADLGIRARLRGWKAYYVPDARVWHHHSSTAGLFSPQKIFWVERNRFWLTIKSFPPGLLALSPLFTANRFFWNLVYAIAGKGAAANFAQRHSLWMLGENNFVGVLGWSEAPGPHLEAAQTDPAKPAAERSRVLDPHETLWHLGARSGGEGLMELHPGFQGLVRKLIPRWIVDRIDPFQAEIDNLVSRAGVKARPGSTVLDAGAGEGRHASRFAHARYVALDRCVGDTRWDYRHVDICGDVTSLPLASGSVDAVLCVVTLEHVEDPAGAILEFARVLKPAGALYLVTPLMWEEHQVPYDYFRFTSWGLRSLLERAGFAVEALHPVGGFFWMLGRRSINMVAFFQTSWRWLLFPLAAILAGLAVPLTCYYLDGLDHEKRHTLGHTVVAVRR